MVHLLSIRIAHKNHFFCHAKNTKIFLDTYHLTQQKTSSCRAASGRAKDRRRIQPFLPKHMRNLTEECDELELASAAITKHPAELQPREPPQLPTDGLPPSDAAPPLQGSFISTRFCFELFPTHSQVIVVLQHLSCFLVPAHINVWSHPSHFITMPFQ